MRPAPKRCSIPQISPRRSTKCSPPLTRREQLHRLIADLLGHSQEGLGRWADVMVNSGTYAEILDRHAELYSRLYWWGSVLDESDPLEEHLSRPRLSRLGPSTQTSGPVEDEWLRDNLVAIAQLAESLEGTSDWNLRCSSPAAPARRCGAAYATFGANEAQRESWLVGRAGEGRFRTRRCCRHVINPRDCGATPSRGRGSRRP